VLLKPEKKTALRFWNRASRGFNWSINSELIRGQRFWKVVCFTVSGNEITWHSFCACEHHSAKGDSNKRWTLKWTKLLRRSLSASLNLRSGFMQIGLLLKRLSRSWISFPVQIVFGYKE
jgi:hypothetical protein